MQGLHTPACRIHSSMITCAAPWLPQGHCQRSGSCYYAFWPLLMILADSRAGTRMMHSWCGRSVWTTRQRWQAGAQRLPALLKDSPTYSEMPLRGGDLVPPVRFVEKFCSRTFCRFCGNISRQPVRNTVVADVHGPVDVEFITCRNHMQRELIFPASDRRVFFALILYFHTTFCARFRLHRNRKTDPLPSLAHCCPPQHKGEFGQCKRVSPSAAFLIADALDNAGAFGAIHHHVLNVPALWRRQGQRHRVPPWRGDGGPAVVRRGAEIQQ